MSLGKKLLGLSIGYAAYQIITNKKYKYLQNDLKSVIDANRKKIIEALDAIDLLVSTPTEAGNEKNRLAIEEEISKIKRKLAEFESKKLSEKTNNETKI